MANRTFTNDGFWDRVEIAVKKSGKTKNQIAKEMGVERKSLYATKSANGSDRSWHSGRLASFCKVTGVSADWLLGLKSFDSIAEMDLDSVQFRVIDKRTGKEPVYDHNHLFKEKWFKQSQLIWCDINSWCISEDGYLVLTDDCGNVGYPPQDRYKIVFINEEGEQV